jgi:anaerobic selenocysteine-containing dehydrogenase
MLVTVEDGRAIAVRGDPEHPFTRGGLCVKVNYYEQRVYSPDRVLHPLKRSGSKGTGRFKRIGWDEALQTIRDHWTGVIAKFGPKAILPYSYLGTEGILNGLNVGEAFFNKLGATISERTFCDSGSCTAYFMTIGPSHHSVGMQHHQHQLAPLAVHRRGEEQRREVGRDRSGQDADGTGSRLAYSDPSWHRRSTRDGYDERHHR